LIEHVIMTMLCS